jgi:hypothetical protein
MGEYSEVFVAIDVSKKKHAVAIAESGRRGEILRLQRTASADRHGTHLSCLRAVTDASQARRAHQE